MDSNQKKATKVPLTESLESAGTSAPAAGETIAPKSGKPVASSEGDRVAAEPAIDKNSGGAVRQKFWHRMRESKNLYLWIFAVIILLAGAGTYIALNWQNKFSKPSKKADSLTGEQLAQLQGNVTIVGDPKQTLDIQGNSVFEGQVLVRNDLDISGSVKVGGSLSLPAITVGGTSSFGQVQVNNTLSVSGNSAVSGTLSVNKSLSVSGNGSFGGSLTAASLSVNSLQMSGDLIINRHIAVGGATPGKTNGGALGSGGTASVSGTDTAGTITINTGSSPPAGNFVTITFVNHFNTTPHVVVTPVGSAAASLQFYVTRSTTSFTLSTASAPPAGSNFSFDYIVFD